MQVIWGFRTSKLLVSKSFQAISSRRQHSIALPKANHVSIEITHSLLESNLHKPCEIIPQISLTLKYTWQLRAGDKTLKELGRLLKFVSGFPGSPSGFVKWSTS